MSDPTLLAYIPSPAQGVWHLGPFPLRAYALCIIVGIVVAVWWGDRRWRARGGQPGDVLDVALFAVPFGLVGGRLYHVLTDWNTYFGANGKGLSGALAIWDGGLGIWGAVIVGALGAWIACRFWKGIKLPAFGDAIAPPILLAQAIGRLGNYFNQELYGGQTTVPWGLELYWREDGARRDIALPNGVSTGDLAYVVHPTFLYEMLWNILVVIALVLIDRQFRIGHGRLFALYVAGYCLGRFGVEMLRTDPATHILGLRINLFTSAILFLCAALYFVLAPRGRETGLEMYRPERAEELAAEGVLGYVPPTLEDDDDEPDAGDLDDRERGAPGDSASELGDPDRGVTGGGEPEDEQAQWAAPLVDDDPIEDVPVVDDTVVDDAVVDDAVVEEAVVVDAAVDDDDVTATDDVADTDEADAEDKAGAEDEADAEAVAEDEAEAVAEGEGDADTEVSEVENADVENTSDAAENSAAIVVLGADADATRDAGGIEIREVITADPEASMMVINSGAEAANDAAEEPVDAAPDDADTATGDAADTEADDSAEDVDDAHEGDDAEVGKTDGTQESSPQEGSAGND